MSANGACHYHVEHSTAYRYSEPVMLSHQQLHLTPRSLAHQHSRAHEIVITPAPTLRREIKDAFGNPMTEIAIESAHSALEIVARTDVGAVARATPDVDTTTP